MIICIELPTTVLLYMERDKHIIIGLQLGKHLKHIGFITEYAQYIDPQKECYIRKCCPMANVQFLSYSLG